MVITLYADRRTQDIADIAGRLARALHARVPAPGVVVAAPASVSPHVPAGVEHALIARGGTPGDVTADLRRLAERYPVTLVAWSGAPNEHVLAACDLSERVLLLSDPSVASLRATQRALKLCASLGYGIDKVAVVLHGFADDTPLAPGDAAGALKREIYWVIPGDGVGEGARAASYEGLADRLHPSRPRG